MPKDIRDAELLSSGVGCYTAPEAARLLKTSPRKISRWLDGYAFKDASGEIVQAPPLWTPQWPRWSDSLEIGFQDLIELRFVLAFVKKGVSLNVIRRCHDNARALLADERPFSKHRFRTDGRRLFLESLREGQEGSQISLTDLKTNQMVFREVVEQTFKDLDFVDGSAAQWRPYGGKASIVIDPNRSFGKPLAAGFGVPTVALANAARVEGSAKRVARLFEVPVSVVNDAVAFERSLLAA
jgi:uncharacterized protein (DUF433 family)